MKTLKGLKQGENINVFFKKGEEAICNIDGKTETLVYKV